MARSGYILAVINYLCWMNDISRRKGKTVDEGGNPRAVSHKLMNDGGYIGLLMFQREILFVREVLDKEIIGLSVFRVICVMAYLLKLRKSLYVSVDRLMSNEYFMVSYDNLYGSFAGLVRRGYLIRRQDTHKTGRYYAVHYGLTAHGKALVRLYGCYMAGEYDGELPVLRGMAEGGV